MNRDRNIGNFIADMINCDKFRLWKGNLALDEGVVRLLKLFERKNYIDEDFYYCLFNSFIPVHYNYPLNLNQKHKNL